MITRDQLLAIMPTARQRADQWLAPLNGAMAEFQINTPLRQAAFLSQVAHESGELRYVRELASGAAYDTGRLAARLGNTPEADGDGQRYKGRGPIQLTGRRNYLLAGFALGLDLLAQPELVEKPDVGARTSAWFWWNNGLNELADRRDFRTITRRINGGFNHYEQRLDYYERAQRALGIGA